VGDNILKEVGGEEITDAREIRVQNGTLTAVVHVGDRWLPLVGKTLIKSIGNNEITDAKGLNLESDGTLTGMANIEGKWYHFKGDELLEPEEEK
jgi:hypothetical protein